MKKKTPEQLARELVEDESLFTKENREPKEMVSLSGTAVTTGGKLTKSNYFRFLKHDLDKYDDVILSSRQAKRVHTHIAKLSTGAAAMTPIYCGGAICPFASRCPFVQMKDAEDPEERGDPVHGKAPIGRQCHPKGAMILTSKHGHVPIEELDPEIHTLVSWERKTNVVRRGRNKVGSKFRVSKTFRIDSNLTTFTLESGKSYTCTHDHICVAKFNENAIGKFVVYLMRKGNIWRVGKSKLIVEYGENQYNHKTFLAFPNRGNRERADDMWILGVYETNSEALLMEDYFSIFLQVSKACFTYFQDQQKVKWNGLYKWVSQEQLDNHHQMCSSVLDRDIEGKLMELGLSADYPVWSRSQYAEEDTGFKLYVRWPMYIRACNILPEVMDMITVKDNSNQGQREKIVSAHKRAPANEAYFDGYVYSLEVLPHETYVVNDIVTHNCIIEVQLMKEWIVRYFNEYDVDPNNFTEVAYVNELAEIEILLMRLNMNIAKVENAELVIDQVINIAHDGTPIVQKALSPFMEQKERLQSRRSKIVKLMVGDRQEKYKKEAALKVKLDADPSSQMAQMRSKIENLSRQLDGISTPSKQLPGKLSPEDLINSDGQEEMDVDSTD